MCIKFQYMSKKNLWSSIYKLPIQKNKKNLPVALFMHAWFKEFLMTFKSMQHQYISFGETK